MHIALGPFDAVEVEAGGAVGEEVEAGLYFAELILQVVLAFVVAEACNLPAAVGNVNGHASELHDVEELFVGGVAALVFHAGVLLLLTFLLQLTDFLAYLFIELVIDVGAEHVVVLEEGGHLLGRQLLLHLYHADVRGCCLAIGIVYVLGHRDAEMLVFPEGGEDGAVACQTGSKGDDATVGELLQVDVFLQLARHGIVEGLGTCAEGLGIGKHLLQEIFLEGHAIGQHYSLGHVERVGDVVILLSMNTQGEAHR